MHGARTRATRQPCLVGIRMYGRASGEIACFDWFCVVEVAIHGRMMVRRQLCSISTKVFVAVRLCALSRPLRASIVPHSTAQHSPSAAYQPNCTHHCAALPISVPKSSTCYLRARSKRWCLNVRRLSWAAAAAQAHQRNGHMHTSLPYLPTSLPYLPTSLPYLSTSLPQLRLRDLGPRTHAFSSLSSTAQLLSLPLTNQQSRQAKKQKRSVCWPGREIEPGTCRGCDCCRGMRCHYTTNTFAWVRCMCVVRIAHVYKKREGVRKKGRKE
ncbi:uncharacterized protein J3D65DRAFT_49276 [Phyllosticta citribraziliensis]|uniref:Uncharacterized protein n=1 Tax=Phyllosticta citribraziliensis TaxID=989973 RepID=A0ABR1ME67_9PEZI